MSFGPIINELVDSLRVLPGVGQKTAQRMALHLLERDRDGARALSRALAMASERITRCSLCQNLSDTDICHVCSNTKRDRSVLCVVETPSDLLAIEQSQNFNGLYFVLMGNLSPLDGRGPDEIGIPKLVSRVQNEEIEEVILATNPTIEGEATAHYIAEILRPFNITVTRLAHGIPVGGELGYVDGGTLSHAFSGRKPVI